MKSKYNRDYIWKSKDGTEWKVRNLTNEHLCKLVAYVEQRCLLYPFFAEEYNGFADYLRKEVEFRKLGDFFKKFMGRDLYLKPTLIDQDVEISNEIKKIAELLGRYPFKPDPEQLPKSKDGVGNEK